MKFTRSLFSLLLLIIVLGAMIAEFSAKKAYAKKSKFQFKEGARNGNLVFRRGKWWNPLAAAKKAAEAAARFVEKKSQRCISLS